MTEIFAEAIPQWNLTELYRDIANIKGNPLTNWEKTCLRGLLCRYSPKAIAAETYWTVGSLRTELSRRLYPFIAALTKQDRIVWHKIADDLAKLGYKNLEQLKTDLVDVSQPVIDRDPAISVSDIITTVGKLTALSSRLPLDSHTMRSINRAIECGHKYAKAGNQHHALESYYLALSLSTSVDVNILISIARCYDRLGQYSDSLAICYFSLSFISEAIFTSPSHCKVYNFIGHVFHELAITKGDSAYLTTALDYYDRAIASNPLDILPIWNQIDLILRFVTQDVLNTSTEKDLYLNTAMRRMESLLEVAKQGYSHDRYHQQILVDMRSTFDDLDLFWQNQYRKFQQIYV
jgi:tetratricopeptide (TPR) repeat protein